ncbi:MAG: hypothetical protein KDB27_10310 [Planctomycetales bacterium]|nr:hypothetical protein [Planctomycetales bacterium]
MTRRKIGSGFGSLEDRRLMTVDLCVVAGDSNFDGVFDSGDLVDVFQSAKYETGQSATVEEGDWNGDELFNSSDLVYAFQANRFEKPFSECRISNLPVVFTRPSDGLFSSYYLSITEDDGTIVPGSDIAYIVTDHRIEMTKDGNFKLTVVTHTSDEFTYTFDSLRTDTITDQWGKEWTLDEA